MRTKPPKTSRRTKRPISRKCPRCYAELVPTDRTAYGGSHRFYECPNGDMMPTLWVDKPYFNGAYAEKHQMASGEFSGQSMLNDPDCGVFSKEARDRALGIRRSRRTK